MDQLELQRRIDDLLERTNWHWFWLGSVSAEGLPRFWVPGGSWIYVHRFLYEVKYGPLPREVRLTPLCWERLCCKTSHHMPGILTGGAAELKKLQAQAKSQVRETPEMRLLSIYKVLHPAKLTWWVLRRSDRESHAVQLDDDGSLRCNCDSSGGPFFCEHALAVRAEMKREASAAL